MVMRLGAISFLTGGGGGGRAALETPLRILPSTPPGVPPATPPGTPPTTPPPPLEEGGSSSSLICTTSWGTLLGAINRPASNCRGITLTIFTTVAAAGGGGGGGVEGGIELLLRSVVSLARD